MFFLSEQVTAFLQDKLGYSSDQVKKLQASYYDTVFNIELGETIYYLEENEIEDLLSELDEIQRKMTKTGMGELENLVTFINKVADQYPEIQEKIGDKIYEYQEGLMDDTFAILDEQSQRELQQVILSSVKDLKSLYSEKKVKKVEV